ncbi:MAG: bifunctional phosphoribosylaminoimidazolecarboxamide formyltransferase/IMP cyclohydrolase [ANME-2 cluster archaeon]|nr:bifunctional phosphoribosylaminoimidazolecarboxamide formyltransferase/IMP cyclohydrolase [ANME-2 cluster archaeon]
MVSVKRALLSVSEKTGIVDFAKALTDMGVEIISTGGTARTLRDAGITVKDVSDITDFPEMMDGRVKTLHPKIHGGLLCLRDNSEHLAQAQQHDIQLIDLVAVNLYPFRETVAKKDVTLEDAIENIDIGGPTMVRASAKNYKHVAIVTDPADYQNIITELQSDGRVSALTREKLAVKAFRHTADYDSAIDTYLSKHLADEDVLRLKFVSGRTLRYGENWHQWAKFYSQPDVEGASLSKAVQHHGKEMSYNNYVDADNAMQTIMELQGVPAACVVKHNNPCGLATGNTLHSALSAAWDGDPVSAFGSIICFNRTVDLDTATFMKGKFVELILAPGFEPEALEFLKEKSKDLRLLELPEMDEGIKVDSRFTHIMGGMLQQSRDIGVFEKWDVVSEHEFPASKRGLAEFSMAACKRTKSNSVIIAWEYSKGRYMVLGMGAGQPNRVDSIRKLAITKARENLELIYEKEKPDIPFDDYVKDVMSECVLSSDAFFPFDDSIIHSAEHNLRYIVSPGGSIRDEEVIATANRLGVSLVFTGMRHFNH